VIGAVVAGRSTSPSSRPSSRSGGTRSSILFSGTRRLMASAASAVLRRGVRMMGMPCLSVTDPGASRCLRQR